MIVHAPDPCPSWCIITIFSNTSQYNESSAMLWVHLTKRLIPFVAPAFWNIAISPLAITLSFSIPDKILVDIFCKSGYSCTWGINITLSFAPLSFAPCFFRKVCNKFRFIQNNLTVDVFSMIMKELKLRTCWLLDGNLTVFGHSGLYGQNSFLSLYGI